MVSFTVLAYLIPLFGIVAAFPFPNLDNTIDCGNGIFCTSSQTCMSNATGAGLVYACSPLPNAVRCMDARYSCPETFKCGDDFTCFSVTSDDASPSNSNSNSSSSSSSDAVINVDAFKVDSIRNFGQGMKPTALSICGSITNHFRLPNFCTCTDARFGGELACTIGLQNYISIGASAWVLPCASPASVGYNAWASLLGRRSGIGRTWTAVFSTNVPIPGAVFELGVASVGAHAELSGQVNRFIISTRFAIGVCARIGVGVFSKEVCNPAALRWLPITILNGPRIDFTTLCN